MKSLLSFLSKHCEENMGFIIGSIYFDISFKSFGQYYLNLIIRQMKWYVFKNENKVFGICSQTNGR